MKKKYYFILFLLLVSHKSFALVINTSAKYAYVQDVSTGSVLLQKKANTKMHPASLTKILTAYVIFKKISQNKLHFSDKISIPVTAWKEGGFSTGSSTMFLRPHQKVSVENLLKGMLVQSANDACITLAEKISGSEKNFAKLLNDTAKKLGLKNSHFINSTGWPAPNHLTTVHDLSVVANTILKEYPQYLKKFFSLNEFTFNNVKQLNRNPLIGHFNGATGMKTGHTEASGYGVIGTASRKNRTIVMVLNGLKTIEQRKKESIKILNWVFNNTYNKKIFNKGYVISNILILNGVNENIRLISKQDIVITLLKKNKTTINMYVKVHLPIKTPIKANTYLADLIIKYYDKKITYPLYSKNAINSFNFLTNISKHLQIKSHINIKTS